VPSENAQVFVLAGDIHKLLNEFGIRCYTSIDGLQQCVYVAEGLFEDGWRHPDMGGSELVCHHCGRHLPCRHCPDGGDV